MAAPVRTPAAIALGVLLLLAAAGLLIVIDPVLAWDDANPYLGKGRLFLYFTSQSNILAVIALTVHGVALVRGLAPSRAAEYLRGLAVVDLAITGIVNGVLLAEPGAAWDLSDFVLHQAAPLLMLAWWLVLPPRQPLPFAAIGLWLVHPVLWTASVLTYAGESSDRWYPYFFLDPAEVESPFLFIAIIHVVIAVLGLLAVLATRLPWRSAGWRAQFEAGAAT